MGKFLESEKPNQVAFKRASDSFSTEAQFDGYYRPNTGHSACRASRPIRTCSPVFGRPLLSTSPNIRSNGMTVRTANPVITCGILRFAVSIFCSLFRSTASAGKGFKAIFSADRTYAARGGLKDGDFETIPGQKIIVVQIIERGRS